jgi:hypothetical protein
MLLTKTNVLRRTILFSIAIFIATISNAQWTTVDLINFNGAAYESNIATGGSAYWDLATNPPAGPRNGLINGTWEVANTGLGATQSPSNAANGRFLMYWSDQDYTGSSPVAAAGTVWSKTYTGLLPGKIYRYSFKSGYLVCPSCTAPAGASLPSLRVYLNAVQVSTLPTMTASWSSFSYTFTASSTTQTLSIYNTSSAVVGNDFGLDDIKLELMSVVTPVKLSSFTVQKDNDCGNRLSWKTESEVNFKQFQILKSTDGRTFTKTGVVVPGTNISGGSYSFTDKSNLQSKSFYRLLMEDLDGNTEESNVVQINGCASAGITIFPNPATDRVSISGLRIGSPIQITDATGKVLLSKPAGKMTETIPVEHLQKALYIITITDYSSGQKLSYQFIKN